MSNARQVMPIAGLVGTLTLAVYTVTQLHAQTAVSAIDFRNAAIAEVQDGQGQIILRGQFAVADEQDDDDVERKAALQEIKAHDNAGYGNVIWALVNTREFLFVQ